ncbi:MAG: CBS domain-containing protein [Magnetococcus sp. WYHC-3]
MKTVQDFMFTDLPILSPQTTLMTAARQMVKHGPGVFAVVMDHMTLSGMITEYDLVRWIIAGHDFETKRLGELRLSAPQVVHESTPIQDLIKIYNQRRFRRFPVVNQDDMLCGGVMEREIIASLPRSNLLAHYRVADMVHSPPPLMTPPVGYMEVARRLVEWHRGCVMIGSGTRLEGMITESTMIRARLLPHWTPDLPATAFMRTQMDTIEPDRDLIYALEFFDRTGRRRLPVVDREGRLLGLVTQTDILKSMAQSVRSHLAVLNPEDIREPALWVENGGEFRILAMNEKGMKVLQRDLSAAGQSAHMLTHDPDLWDAVATLLSHCGRFGPVNLAIQMGGGDRSCLKCSFMLVETPSGESRIFCTMGEGDSAAEACRVPDA